MNFDKPGACGMCEAAEHLTVLKSEAKGATVQNSPRDTEAQYGRSYTEELASGADEITKGKTLPDLRTPADNR